MALDVLVLEAILEELTYRMEHGMGVDNETLKILVPLWKRMLRSSPKTALACAMRTAPTTCVIASYAN